MTRVRRRFARIGAAGLCLALFALARDARAVGVDVPVLLDHPFLRQALLEQLFREPGQRARVLDDGLGCNELVLSDPILSHGEGDLRVRMQMETRIGTPVRERCVLPIDATRDIEISLRPALDESGTVVRFRVVDSRLLARGTTVAVASSVVWDAVKKHVHPWIAGFRVDLGSALRDVRSVIPLFVGDADAERTRAIVDSTRLAAVVVLANGVQATLHAEVPPPALPAPSAPPEPELTPEEFSRFAAAVKRWDGFLTHVLKRVGAETASREDRDELLAILLDARGEMLAVLDPTQKRPADGVDPVRRLFARAWQRLAPVLRRLGPRLPGEGGLRYLGFVAAGDALAALDRAGRETGFEISADGLRRMARVVAPGSGEDPVAAPDRVDPELREVFGFGEPIELPPDDVAPPPAEPAPEQPPAAPAAPAAPQDESALPELLRAFLRVEPVPLAELSARLRQWVPSRRDADRYLPVMRELLVRAADLVLAKTPIDLELQPAFRHMVLATAWKESCWRQFVSERGVVRTIRSSVGALGVMQVSPRVWRGFYEPKALESDAAYNARAGTEILRHYFVDFAIARGEHLTGEGTDGAIRATYAAYNGGPGHLRRWRKPGTPKSLKAIDAAFWKRYRAVREGRDGEVALCFAS